MTSSIDQLPSIAQTVSSEMVALVRLDLNVPRDPKGEITDDTRIRAALPTLKLLQEKARRLVIMSHLGRPKSEAFDEQYSLRKVAEHVAGLLGQPVNLTSLGDAPLRDADFDGILMLENVRFNRVKAQTTQSWERDMPPCAMSLSSTHSPRRTAPKPQPLQ